MKMPIFSTLWTSWKWRRFLEVWRACSNVLHSLSFQLFTLHSLPPFAVNFYLLKVCHPSWVSFSVSAISLPSWSSPPGHLCYFSNSFFWFFPPFPLGRMGSDLSCTGWPPLHWVLLCKLHVASMGVLPVCTQCPESPTCPSEGTCLASSFLDSAAFSCTSAHAWCRSASPSFSFFSSSLSTSPFSSSSSSSPPCHLALPSLSLCRALPQFQPCLFHTEFCTLFYRCSSSKLTAHFPPCLPLISAIFVNKFWWHYFL